MEKEKCINLLNVLFRKNEYSRKEEVVDICDETIKFLSANVGKPVNLFIDEGDSQIDEILCLEDESIGYYTDENMDYCARGAYYISNSGRQICTVFKKLENCVVYKRNTEGDIIKCDLLVCYREDCKYVYDCTKTKIEMFLKNLRKHLKETNQLFLYELVENFIRNTEKNEEDEEEEEEEEEEEDKKNEEEEKNEEDERGIVPKWYNKVDHEKFVKVLEWVSTFSESVRNEILHPFESSLKDYCSELPLDVGKEENGTIIWYSVWAD